MITNNSQIQEFVKLLKMIGRAFSIKDEGIIVMDYLTDYKVIEENMISSKLNLQPNSVKSCLQTYENQGILVSYKIKGEQKKYEFNREIREVLGKRLYYMRSLITDKISESEKQQFLCTSCNCTYYQDQAHIMKFVCKKPSCNLVKLTEKEYTGPSKEKFKQWIEHIDILIKQYEKVRNLHLDDRFFNLSIETQQEQDLEYQKNKEFSTYAKLNKRNVKFFKEVHDIVKTGDMRFEVYLDSTDYFHNNLFKYDFMKDEFHNDDQVNMNLENREQRMKVQEIRQQAFLHYYETSQQDQSVMLSNNKFGLYIKQENDKNYEKENKIKNETKTKMEDER